MGGGSEDSDQAGPTISGYLERTGKYTAAWKKRYISFVGNTRVISYSESKEKGSKSTMTLTKVLRRAEFDDKLHRGHPDLFTLIVEGRCADGTTESWKLRCPDESTFLQWYDVLRNALAHAGLMPSAHFGLPSSDPRNGLTFATVPVEYLLQFSLLEKAILYWFGRIQLHLPPGVGSTGFRTSQPVGDLFFMIGDKYCYVFKPNADVVRIFDPTSIVNLVLSEGYVGIKLNPPEHDLLIKNCFNRSLELIDVLTRLYRSLSGGKDLEIEHWKGAVDELAEKLKLEAREGYKMNVVSPTPKVKLRQALDKFSKQHGIEFSVETATTIANQSKGAVETQVRERERNASFAPGVDLDDPMVVLLCRLDLRQYVNKLVKQHIDLDMLTCMEPNDLCNFGINDPAHRQRIIDGANGRLAGSGSAPTEDEKQQQRIMQQRREEQQRLAVQQAASGDPATSPRREVHLSDSESSDDLDVPQPQPGAAVPPSVPKPAVVNLDDSDDDLPVPVPAATLGKAAPVILLESDDDEEDLLPVVRPSAASPAPAGVSIDGGDI